MSGVNKVILVGNLGNDPEIKQFQDGGLVANFTVATSEKWTDKQGQKKEETEWHKVSFGGRLAEICRDYLKKGSKVYVEGKLKTRKWQDKDGKDNYTTEVKGVLVQMLDSRANTGDAGTARQIPSSPQPVDDFSDDSIPF